MKEIKKIDYTEMALNLFEQGKHKGVPYSALCKAAGFSDNIRLMWRSGQRNCKYNSVVRLSHALEMLLGKK